MNSIINGLSLPERDNSEYNLNKKYITLYLFYLFNINKIILI